MHPLQFFTFLGFTLVTYWGVTNPWPALALPVLFVFVGIPLVDAIVGTDKRNPAPAQEKSWKLERVWGPALYVYAITHFVILAVGLEEARTQTSWLQVAGLALVTGLYTGGLGITVGHELCHKKEFFPRALADLVLSSVWYQHFAVEHVRGHHLMVSTPEDPASARLGESAYRFVLRSVIGSFQHALKLDRKSVIGGVGLALAFTLVSAYLGLKPLAFFILQSIVAIVLLELVNYIEHYGLERRALGNGRYEKVTPIHSWNSAHKFSNLILFNLQRHSDHHALAHLPYTVLKHHEDAPQLPSGYPGMVLLALVPKTWFRIMDPKVQAWRERYTSTSA